MRGMQPLLLLPLFTLLALAWPDSAHPYAWNLPKGFPKPYVPADNPMTPEKVELGRYLFYDTRMSVNGKASCATCHKQELAFTDGRAVSLGATGQLHSRSAMSLVNVAYSGALTWSNPRMKSLEEQALVPMFGDHPVELGLKREAMAFCRLLRSDAKIPDALRTRLSGRTRTGSRSKTSVKAIACFERSIISARSPYDRYHYGGDDSAVSDSAKRGEVLFFQPAPFMLPLPRRIQFQRRHGVGAQRLPGIELSQHRALPSCGTALLPRSKRRHLRVHQGRGRRGKVQGAHAAEYRADRSRICTMAAFATLEGVLDHYAAGGRTIESGPHAGIGHDNPNKDPLIGGFALSRQDRADLIAFLKSLTDEEVRHDPRFANPW